jgi:TP901-1 family phage major tail protein
MAAQKGRDILLKRGNGDGPPETFTAVAGIRTTSIDLNSAAVDVSTADSDGWRELLAGAGIKTFSLAGGGVFKDDATQASVTNDYVNDVMSNWQIIIPAMGTFAGQFQVQKLSIKGDHDKEVSFDISLESASPLTFTPA